MTFDSGDTSKSFTFTAAHDTVDDDGESVKLSFGATLPDGVTAGGTTATSAVTITDDDVPSVTVSFGSAAYTVAESDDSDTTNVTENTVEVTVDPRAPTPSAQSSSPYRRPTRAGPPPPTTPACPRTCHLRQRGHLQVLRLHRRPRHRRRRRRERQAELRGHAADDACDRHGGDTRPRGHGHHHRRRRSVRHRELRERRLHRGRERRLGYHRRNGEHRRGDRHPQRRSRAHGRHPHREDQPGRGLRPPTTPACRRTSPSTAATPPSPSPSPPPTTPSTTTARASS